MSNWPARNQDTAQVCLRCLEQNWCSKTARMLVCCQGSAQPAQKGKRSTQEAVISQLPAAVWAISREKNYTYAESHYLNKSSGAETID